MKTQVSGFMAQNHLTKDTVISMEKQVLSGHSSPLMFYVQMTVYELLYSMGCESIINPLPIQLKSFIKRFEGGAIGSKSDIVNSFKEKYGRKMGIGRISSHCVDAFYLVRLAEETLAGNWSYALSVKELKLHPWKVIASGPKTSE